MAEEKELRCRKCNKVIFESYDLPFPAELNKKVEMVILHLCGLCYHTILDNYEIPGMEKVQENLGKKVKNHQGRVCPLCGQIFARKNGFPLYSKYGELLVCKKCKQKEVANG